MNKNINSKIERINIENFIWLIFFFLIGFNLYSNYLEKKYILANDKNARKKFREINKIVLTISLIIYFYFLYISWNDVHNLKYNDSENKKKLATYSFIASILFVLAGIITLYVVCNVNVLDEENELGII